MNGVAEKKEFVTRVNPIFDRRQVNQSPSLNVFWEKSQKFLDALEEEALALEVSMLINNDLHIVPSGVCLLNLSCTGRSFVSDHFPVIRDYHQ